MLNKDSQRELAYVVTIDDIKPIEGADRVELAIVGGWRIMVQKGQFKVGDPAIYFEIDSKVPETEPFKFLEKVHYKIKTQKYFKGTVISQGLLMSAEDFGWTVEKHNYGYSIHEQNGAEHNAENESRFLTKVLGVTYYDPADQKRKAAPVDVMPRRGKKLWKWLMKRRWGRWIVNTFYPAKKKHGWPEWVKKTDEERIQNMPWILEDKEPWVVTEKVDGSSATFAMKRGKWPHKNEYYVCSRNVVLYSSDQKTYYDQNYYWEMAEKYNMKDVLTDLLSRYPTADWVYIQGEVYGSGVQKRTYRLNGRDLAIFNLVFSHCGRLDTVEMAKVLCKYELPIVPILDDKFTLLPTVDEMLDYAEGKSAVDGEMREGVVIRSQDGQRSFKVVSNKYLMKYH